MTTDELSKEIINSNLSDDTKIELLKQIILKDILTPTIIKIDSHSCEPYNDSSWWQQHMMNGTADADSILRPFATW